MSKLLREEASSLRGNKMRTTIKYDVRKSTLNDGYSWVVIVRMDNGPHTVGNEMHFDGDGSRDCPLTKKQARIEAVKKASQIKADIYAAEIKEYE